MTYILINPVTEKMYDPDVLKEFLKKHRYESVSIHGDWMNCVKEKYKRAVKESKHTVMDMRCPKIRSMVEHYGLENEVTAPDILPILIHCGIEMSEREDLRGEKKVVTTPCKALADLGNSLNLLDTCFIPWNQFVELTDEVLEEKLPDESPIPPGFFENTGMKVCSITGEEKIRAYMEDYRPDDTELVEMLFCKDGCHNGDGIRK